MISKHKIKCTNPTENGEISVYVYFLLSNGKFASARKCLKFIRALKAMWKFGLFIVCAASLSMAVGKQGSSKKFTIEQLQSTSFPYTDPRTDYQLDMDPCKSGKWYD